MELELIDIGVNLGDSAFDKDRDAIVERAVAAGVMRLILTGTTLAESQTCLKLAEHYGEHTYTTAGIHPHYAIDAAPQHFNELKSLCNEAKVVAVGETGLDFNRDFSPRPVQEQCFRAAN